MTHKKKTPLVIDKENRLLIDVAYVGNSLALSSLGLTLVRFPEDRGVYVEVRQLVEEYAECLSSDTLESLKTIYAKFTAGEIIHEEK